MKTIWKYKMEDLDDTFEMPGGATIKHFGVQREASGHLQFTFWAECLPGAPRIKRAFGVFDTGQDVPMEAVYHGTVQVPQTRSAELVYHLYELPS